MITGVTKAELEAHTLEADRGTTRGTEPGLTERGRLYRTLQRLGGLLFRGLSDFRVEGLENYPAEGPYLVTINHLALLDVPAIFTTLPHHMAGLTAREWAQNPLLGPLMRRIVRVIPVQRDGMDHRALAEALAWLKAGGVLLIAPEGQRTASGALEPGLPGITFLASRANAPIVPVVAWGQERALQDLARLRRPKIVVRVGEPFVLPAFEGRRPRGAELEALTAGVMQRLAALLPERYQGIYGPAPSADGEGSAAPGS